MVIKPPAQKAGQVDKVFPGDFSQPIPYRLLANPLRQIQPGASQFFWHIRKQIRRRQTNLSQHLGSLIIRV
jgi:hypothetical protein